MDISSFCADSAIINKDLATHASFIRYQIKFFSTACLFGLMHFSVWFSEQRSTKWHKFIHAYLDHQRTSVIDDWLMSQSLNRILSRRLEAVSWKRLWNVHINWEKLSETKILSTSRSLRFAISTYHFEYELPVNKSFCLWYGCWVASQNRGSRPKFTIPFWILSGL